MTSARKLVFAMIAGIVLVLGVAGTIWVRREMAHFDADVREDLSLMGRALRPALVQVWTSDGRERAMEVLEYANQRWRRVDIRWVSRASIEADPALAPLARGEEVARAVAERDAFFYYVPVEAPGIAGALELSQSLAKEQRFVRHNVTLAIAATVAAVLSLAVLAMILGRVAIREANDRIAAEHEAGSRAIEQLRHAERLSTVGKLAAGVAHELGTPLNIVSGRAKMIANRDLSAGEAAESARTIVEQADRMSKIIRQLLDFARRQAGCPALMDARVVARQTANLLEPIAERRGVTLELVEPDEAIAVVADGAQLQQVVTNLVVNAVQASPRGARVVLSVACRRLAAPADVGGGEKEWCVVEVSDEGEGIDPADLPRLFEPFFTTKRVGEGTGLGLSVAYGIVREHGGWIDVDSGRYAGSRFRIHVPRAAEEVVCRAVS